MNLSRLKKGLDSIVRQETENPLIAGFNVEKVVPRVTTKIKRKKNIINYTIIRAKFK